MRPIAIVLLLTAHLAGACGRIGYEPLELSGVGGAFVGGAGGTPAGTGGTPAGTGGVGSGGASQQTGSGGATGSGGNGNGGNAPGSGGTAGGGTGGNATGGSGSGGMAGASATGGSASGGAGAPGTGGRATGGGAGGTAGQVAGTGGGGGAGSDGSCSTGTFGGHTYAFCVGPVAWMEAQADCAAKGMRLVRIDDSAENAWLQSVAFAGISSMSSVYWSWIGATDAAVAAQWRWTDGALFWMGGANGTPQGGLYSNWAGGSPSNGGTGADCGILQHSGFWKDFDCATAERYICERD